MSQPATQQSVAGKMLTASYGFTAPAADGRLYSHWIQHQIPFDGKPRDSTRGTTQATRFLVYL
jgi:hypothetical protein